MQLEGGTSPSPCKGHGCPSAASLCRCTDESGLAFLSQKQQCPGKLGLLRASERQVPGGAKFRFALWRDARCPETGRHQGGQKAQGGWRPARAAASLPSLPSPCGQPRECGFWETPLLPGDRGSEAPVPVGAAQEGLAAGEAEGKARSWMQAPRSPGLAFRQSNAAI